MKITKARFHVPHLEELVDLLDEVVRQQAGSNIADTTRRIRHHAVERRAGMPEAEERLIAELERLKPSEESDIIRALTMYFDLANLAEDLNRIRTLQSRSRFAESPRDMRKETIYSAIDTLKQRGLSASETQSLLSRMRLEFVFTAHPSEAKRRTTRRILRRLRETLIELTQPKVSPDERPRLVRKIRADITAMWQSNLLRPSRPGVMSEVERGLFFAKNLWKVVPEIARDMRESLACHYPGTVFELPAFVRFGTWIGGDRDGNPFVTTETTAQALAALRETALNSHLQQCRELMDIVVTSERHATGLDRLRDAATEAIEKMPSLDDEVSRFIPSELGRKWLKIVSCRLAATSRNDAALCYQSARELGKDISLLVDVLRESGADDIVDAYVQPWLDNIRCFGFHFASMDIRQHSGVHARVITEILAAEGIHENYSEADEETKRKLLTETIDSPLMPEGATFSEATNEALSLFRLMAAQVRHNELDVFGGYIISMTHDVSDVLAVLWLWSKAWKATGSSEAPPPLPIVPLFETIDDLKRAAAIMETLWKMPAYREYAQRSEHPSQMVMIGYSDSTKDGGYLSATWKLHQAQKSLAKLANKLGTRLIIFHGRGGALGRGGGPAARAVLSLPPGSVDAAMRVTEQGEILAERYDDPAIAFRHLEQVTWATLLVSSETSPVKNAEYDTAMEAMSDASLEEYRRLVTHPQFLHYFESATPVAEIEGLPIGSRPARRSKQRSLSDLRAIPWTFAWTQSRQIVPAWYGVGTAIRAFVDTQNDDWSLLRTMYEEWPFFAATVDNAELALAKADMDIANRYSQLCKEADAQGVWELIRNEFARSRAAILMLKRQDELLERTAWLQKSIRARNPSVDPLNLLQIRLLREARSTPAPPDEDEYNETHVSATSHLLRLTIHGIAAGLRTTG